MMDYHLEGAFFPAVEFQTINANVQRSSFGSSSGGEPTP